MTYTTHTPAIPIPWWCEMLLISLATATGGHDLTTDLRSHEPPRNSGEGTAVNGPMPLEGEDDANATA